MEKYLSLHFFILFVLACSLSAQTTVHSPNGLLKVRLNEGEELNYDIIYKDVEILKGAKIAMFTDRGNFGKSAKSLSVKTLQVNTIIDCPFGLRAKISDFYNQSTVEFEKFNLILRLYDDAVCWRFETDLKGEITVFDELATFPFNEESTAYAYPMKSHKLHFQQVFEYLKLKNFDRITMAIAPLLITLPDSKTRIAISDSDVHDYPSINFNKPEKSEVLSGLFAKYPLDFERSGNAFHPKKRTDYIAKTFAPRAFPWRIVIVTDDDKVLLDNDTVFKLASSNKLDDISWISGGACAWEWWHSANLEGVDFETGKNLETYKYYIDFAHKNKIPFMLVDGGWLDSEKWRSDTGNLAKYALFDVGQLCAYATAKGVKIMLWVRSADIIDMEVADSFFKQIKSWGAAGAKVDFVERDDQQAMNYYEQISKLAASHKLLVEWHGCPKSTGLYKTYPNIINEEGVRGAELNKMTNTLTPDHNISLLFTRAIAGHFDYTPGALRNVSKGKSAGANFAVIKDWPMAYGTRMHQICMYILYNEPLKKICDSPTEYDKYPQLLKFIAECPTTWDESQTLAASFNEYAAIARRKKDDWYLGAMTNWEERTLEIKLDFLESGAIYEALILCDTQNSKRLAIDFKVEKRTFKQGDTLKIEMAEGGGFAAKFVKQHDTLR